MTITTLHSRPSFLRDFDHRYIWEPTGEQMNVSVTGVVNHDKPPYSGPPEAAWRGTHGHRCMEALATGSEMPDPISPEGIDCSAWFKQLQAMTFWNEIDVIACEYTMVSRRKSLGGQLDLLCRYTSPTNGKTKTLLVDLKTKGASWSSASKDDVFGYKAQAGGYSMLLDSGDDAHGGCWVDECRTLVVTPDRVKWLPAMTPQSCSDAWLECWERYSAYLIANPF